jgi:hypothetical protein
LTSPGGDLRALDVEGFSAVPTGADGFGRATLFDLQALTLKDVLISPERAE